MGFNSRLKGLNKLLRIIINLAAGELDGELTAPDRKD